MQNVFVANALKRKAEDMKKKAPGIEREKVH